MRSHVVMLVSGALAVVLSAASCGDDARTTEPRVENDGGSDADAVPALCVDGAPTVAYPPGPYEIAVLGTVPATLRFQGLDGALDVRDFFEPCSTRSRLLVVRSSSAWCGPCRWHVESTTRFMETPTLANRIELVELLIRDEDNAPATLHALDEWKAKSDSPASKFAIDPKYTFGPALLARAPLPEYVLIDTRTMRIVGALSDPDMFSLVERLESELATLDGLPPPPPGRPPPLFDERFTENEVALVQGMRLDDLAPPPDPTNEYADDPNAVEFGKVLFSDALLSPSQKVSCATCHEPKLDLTDGAAQSTGVSKVDRNAPALALAAHSRWQFWDGRADTLWMQALAPFEDPKEFGGSRLFVAKQIAARHAEAYTNVFGSKYPLVDLDRFPDEGKPGDPSYDSLSAEDKEIITRIFVNVGKALAAFERAMRVEPNALDRYAAGELDALTPPQKDGLSLFLRNGCVQCHWGPRLTDDAFHVLRFPTGRQDGEADFGRADGLLQLTASEFLASSQWSDAPSAAKFFSADTSSMLGAFKTPTLRGLPTSAPYGHGGTLNTLLEVSEHYGIRGLEHADSRAVGTTEQWAPNFDTHVVQGLPAFLEVLSGRVVLP